MSNAIGVAWQIPCSGLRSSGMLSTTIRPRFRDLRLQPSRTDSNTLSNLRLFSSLSPFPQPGRPLIASLSSQQSGPTPLWTRSKRTLARKSSPKPSNPSPPANLASDTELKSVFPQSQISSKLAKRTLAVLHSRRLEGTLDLDLPAEITRAVNQAQLDTALEWLRQEYPIDEDAAILARIEREERQAEEKLVRRAEQLGLYKPQSGSYGAELGEENSIYGKSVLKEAREKNEKRLLAEKERKRQQWLEGEHEEQEQLQRQIEGSKELQQYQESALMEARPRADPNERPYLAWVQKHHVAGTHNQVDAADITTRLVSSILFTIGVLGLCYLFSQNYEAPARQDRLWPNVPPAAATVGAIIGANVAITLMWKYVPPSWRLLNRFFIIVPFYPSALIHDEVGRGNFLAIYFASGAVGSLVSLSRSVLLGALATTSLGASAATSGIVAAWCMYHFHDKITLWILPHDLRDTIWTQGWIFLACIVGTEILSMATPARFLRVFPLSRLAKMDHAAHLGGYFVGTGCGYVLMKKMKERKARESQWFEKLVR
ncbi:hypothetical protein N7454_000511 [Penicillium verhagenii]|nr:hypothetical protein N7454_000511 [Penicillium verhagenii]